MKIRKVKWQNHPVLGNLEMDFLKDDRRDEHRAGGEGASAVHE